MKDEPNRQFAEAANRQGDAPMSSPASRHVLLGTGVAALAILLLCSGVAPAQYDDGAAWLRRFIGQQVGGIDRLKVPATDADRAK